ncbi:MAG TPA: hypothetical protein VK709_05875 [Candidatus Saccharimonadales bacterium]|nr:hypothetical protein [Candidatus Saccharimonadales bacterium]
MAFLAVLIFLFSFRLVGFLPFDQPPLSPIHTSSSTALAAANFAASNETLSHPAMNLQNYKKNKKQEQRVQTLTGTIEWEYDPHAWDCDVPNCDHFALYDDATRSNFHVDDARAALPYEGKRVKLTGVVDEKNRSIHLVSIESEK